MLSSNVEIKINCMTIKNNSFSICGLWPLVRGKSAAHGAMGYITGGFVDIAEFGE